MSSEYKLCKDHANESLYQEETTSKSWIDKKCTSEDRLLQEDKFLSLKEKASKFQLSEARLEGDISKRHEDLVKCWFQSKNNNESNHLNKYEVKPKLLKKGSNKSRTPMKNLRESSVCNRDKSEPQLFNKDKSNSRPLQKYNSKFNLCKKDLSETFSSYKDKSSIRFPNRGLNGYRHSTGWVNGLSPARFI